MFENVGKEPASCPYVQDLHAVIKHGFDPLIALKGAPGFPIGMFQPGSVGRLVLQAVILRVIFFHMLGPGTGIGPDQAACPADHRSQRFSVPAGNTYDFNVRAAAKVTGDVCNSHRSVHHHTLVIKQFLDHAIV